MAYLKYYAAFISYHIFSKREFLVKVVHVLGMCGASLYLSTFLSPIPMKFIGLAMVIPAIAFLFNIWLGGLFTVALTVCYILVGMPELGFLFLYGSVGFSIIILFIKPYPMTVLGMVLAPLLVLGNASLVIPICFGLFLKPARSLLYSFLALVWVFIISIPFSIPRFGIESKITLKIQSFSDFGPGLFSGVLNDLTFLPYPGALNELITVDGPLMVAQIVVWCGTAALATFLFEKRQFTDRLAENYLKSVQVVKPRSIPFHKTILGASLLGMVLFIFLSVLVSFVFTQINYPIPDGILMDIVCGILLLVVFQLRYKGDPKHAKKPELKEFIKEEERELTDEEVKELKTPQPPKSKLIKKTSKQAEEKRAASQRRTTPMPGGKKGTLPKGTIKDPDRGKEYSATTMITPRDTKINYAGEFKSVEKEKANKEKEKKEVKKGAAFEVNEKIDDQYVIDKVRAGGMGVVYIVTDEFSKKRYAVKALKEDLLNNEEAVERFSIEAKTWINLDHHENIVQAMLYRVVKKRPLLFLEYINGTDLDKVRKLKDFFPMSQVLDWGKQICKGMYYAHTKDMGGGKIGIIHRDLKPANIMLTRDGVIKITDFGLAKVSDSTQGITKDCAGMGTLFYMPPEQLEDAKRVDKRADVYAFGALFFELITGRPPFNEGSASNLYMAIINRIPKEPSLCNPSCTPELDKIVMKCLEKDPRDRYPNFNVILKDLESIQLDESMSSIPAGAKTTVGLSKPSFEKTQSGSKIYKPITSDQTQLSFPASQGESTASASSSSSGFSGTLIEGILFLDMVASTATGSKYGDNLAFQLKEQLSTIVQQSSKRQNFCFMKGTGDGYLITFPSAQDAVFAAVNILTKMEEYNKIAPKIRKINLRMGVHFGQINTDSQGDRHGTAVNMAARIMDVNPQNFHETKLGVSIDELLDRNRIYVSASVHEEISEVETIEARLLGYFDFKGISGRHQVYEVIWK